MIHCICRLTIAAVWIYQGLVPKILFKHADELAMLADAGVSASSAPTFLSCVGWIEVAFGVAVLLCWKQRWPLWVTLVAMPLAIVGVGLNSPRYLSAAFNPVSMNLLLFAICLVDLLDTKKASAA